MDKNRLIYIDLLRIIAAFFVIFNHTGNYGFSLFTSYDPSGFRYWFYLFFSVLCKVSVPLFFTLSGALLLKRQDEGFRKYASRFLRILIALFLFSVLSYIQQIAMGEETFNVLRFFQVLIQKNWMNVYWYLYTYLGFLLILPLLQKFAHALSDKLYQYMIFLVLLITGILPVLLFILFQGNLLLNENFTIGGIASMIVFYPLLGYYLENRVDIKKCSARFIACLWGANLLCIFATCLATHMRRMQTGVFEQDYLMQLIPFHVIALMISARKLFSVVHCSSKLQTVITTVGSCTFGIYLFHGLFLRTPQFSIWTHVPFPESLPLTCVVIRCLEIMLFSGILTFLLKKIPIVKKLL